MKTLENQNKAANTDNNGQTNPIALKPSRNELYKDSEKEIEKTELYTPEKVPEQEKVPFRVKTEIQFEKPALNLESTLKLVEELHRRKIQRDKLLETIETLEAFEVAQKEDAEETDSNHFQGCVLTIEDDNRRKFSTKNPVIIFSVAQYVNSMCVNRLAEIEAGITIPS